jgi:hypothetical protein
MQYALQEKVEVAIDQSVYDDPIAATRMTLHHEAVLVKGTERAVPVYTICDSKQCAAFRVLETVHGKTELFSFSDVVFLSIDPHFFRPCS